MRRRLSFEVLERRHLLAQEVAISGIDLSADEECQQTAQVVITRTGYYGPQDVDLTFLVHDEQPAEHVTDYVLSVGGQPISDTVTFGTNQTSITVTITPVDDAVLEQNEFFKLGIAPSSESDYSIVPGSEITGWIQIKDNEWRWTEASGPEPDHYWLWADPNSSFVTRTVDRGPLLPDGTLTVGPAVIQSSNNEVSAVLNAQLELPGIFTFNYQINGGTTFSFDCDPATGQIWVDGNLSNLPSGTFTDNYLSGAIGYNYQINDNTGTSIHSVEVKIDFGVVAGGTYNYSVTGGGAAKGGTGTFAIQTVESWKKEVKDGRIVTLYCKKVTPTNDP
jgi:hypothetical protein